MKLAIYEILTQAIILLSWLRANLVNRGWWARPEGRVFDVTADEEWTCCDCDLRHAFVALGEQPAYQSIEKCDHAPPYKGAKVIGHLYPVRPKGYRYRLRATARLSSLAVGGGSPPEGEAS